MNDTDREMLNSGGDEECSTEHLLLQLKQLTPSLTSQLESRRMVATELAKLQTSQQNREKRWWQKNVSVPVPVAVGMAALVLIAWGLQFGPQQKTDLPIPQASNTSETLQLEVGVHVDQYAGSDPSLVMPTSSGSEVLEHYETGTYLCGVGLLSSESGYFIREK